MTDCLESHLVNALSVAALQLAVRAYGLVRDQVGAGNARLRQSVTVVDLKMKRMRNEVNCSNGKIICQKFGWVPARRTSVCAAQVHRMKWGRQLQLFQTLHAIR